MKDDLWTQIHLKISCCFNRNVNILAFSYLVEMSLHKILFQSCQFSDQNLWQLSDSRASKIREASFPRFCLNYSNCQVCKSQESKTVWSKGLQIPQLCIKCNIKQYEDAIHRRCQCCWSTDQTLSRKLLRRLSFPSSHVNTIFQNSLIDSLPQAL